MLLPKLPKFPKFSCIAFLAHAIKRFSEAFEKYRRKTKFV